MKVSYSILGDSSSSSNGNSSSWKILERRNILLIPIIILAVFLGFFLELVTVERLNLFENIYSAGKLSHHQSPPSPQESQEEPTFFVNPDAPTWEQPRLFNVSHFQWLRNNESICKINSRHPKSLILPILVHTARSHFSERQTIRKSWGSLLLYNNWSIRLVFLLGQADRGKDISRNEAQFQKQEAQLDNEQSTYGDLVEGNFIDSYKNLTYKHMMGYKWILNFCSNATFVLKADDDMFIDLMQFLSWRSDELEKMTEKSYFPDLYCSTLVGTKPQRCVGCKWYTSEIDWPTEFFPDYCSGCCYGITVDLIKRLYSVRDTVPFFWIDDVYATGLLMEEVKKENPGFEPKYRHLWGQVRSLDFRNFRPMCERHDISMKRKFGIVVPISRGSHFDRDMMCLWNKTVYDDDARRRDIQMDEQKLKSGDDSGN